MGKKPQFSPSERKAVLCYRKEGKSCRQIARAIYRSPAAVARCIKRGAKPTSVGRPATYSVRTKKAFVQHLYRLQAKTDGRQEVK